MEEPNEISPVKYGALWEKVQTMDRRVEKIEAKMDHLLELANRSKGGLWFGITIVAVVSSIFGVMVTMAKMRMQ